MINAMSLIKPVVVGGTLGLVTSMAIYAASSPQVVEPMAAEASPTPVPAPTKVILDPCVLPAVLRGGVCVTTVPGPTIRVVQEVQAPPAAVKPVTAPAPRPRTTVPAAPNVQESEDHDEHEDSDEHEERDGGEEGHDGGEDGHDGGDDD